MSFSRKKVFIARAFVFSNNFSCLFFAFIQNHLKLWSKVLYGSGYYCNPIECFEDFFDWTCGPMNEHCNEMKTIFPQERVGIFIWNVEVVLNLIKVHFHIYLFSFQSKVIIMSVYCVFNAVHHISSPYFWHLVFWWVLVFVVYFNVLFRLIMKQKSLESMGINMLK
jgi:hypothetical protein